MSRSEIEANAADAEGAPRPGTSVLAALVRLLTAKGLITRERLRRTVESIEMASAAFPAGRIVAKAWADSAFKQRLLADGNAAARELSIEASNANAPTKLVVVANEPDVHNLVVCTLCSCYPVSLLGPSPSWYKSRSYRARAVRRPRELLREFGLDLPKGVTVRVHDSTADLRYFVLPERPEGTDGWSEEQLKALATRDSLVGVALPKPLSAGA